MALLHRLSHTGWERVTALVYGLGLVGLFLVSTVFHIITWKKSHMRSDGLLLFWWAASCSWSVTVCVCVFRSVEHCFHMCDRVVIYVFIAASYTPW